MGRGRVNGSLSCRFTCLEVVAGDVIRIRLHSLRQGRVPDVEGLVGESKHEVEAPGAWPHRMHVLNGLVPTE